LTDELGPFIALSVSAQHEANEAARRAGPSATADTCLHRWFSEYVQAGESLADVVACVEEGAVRAPAAHHQQVLEGRGPAVVVARQRLGLGRRAVVPRLPLGLGVRHLPQYTTPRYSTVQTVFEETCATTQKTIKAAFCILKKIEKTVKKRT